MPKSHLGSFESYSNQLKCLCDWIEVNGERKCANPGDNLSLSDKCSLVYLKAGSWKLNVGGDRIYAFLNAGGVILVPSFSLIANMPPVNYVVNSRSIYYNVSLASALSKIKDMAVLDDIIRLWSFDFLMLTAKWYYQSRDNSYRKIKSSLELLDNLPAIIKEEDSAISFLISTTGVSQSHCLSIMKSLKAGGYIELDAGCLVKIHIPLPNNY